MSLMLADAAAQSITVLTQSIEALTISGTATAYISFGSNGVVTYPDGSYTWFPSEVLNVGASYEIYAEVVASASFVGNIATWVSLSTAKSWSLTAAAGVVSGSLQISIRKAGEVQVLGTGLVTLTAEVAL